MECTATPCEEPEEEEPEEPGKRKRKHHDLWPTIDDMVGA